MSTDLAWLAGVIDGEGSVTLKKSGRSPVLRVAIYANEGPLLDKALRILTEHEVRHSTRWDRRNLKPNCIIEMNTEGSLALHALTRPYLTRLVAQFDAGVAFMSRYRVPGQRTVWTEAARGEWDDLRAAFH